MEPLENCPRETLAAVRGILTDIDDTVSSDGALTAEAYGALQALKKAGLLVIPVTGRPAGWCDHIARFWPVDAVVGENGAFWMWHDHAQKRLRTRFIQSDAERAEGRRRLELVRNEMLQEVPGAGIASDQPYRLADLAVDFCEDVPALSRTEIEKITSIFERNGATAKVSSIHVNGWFGGYDKLTTSRLLLRDCFNLDVDVESDRERIVFAGDSPNDAPMFAFFPNAVGVANIRNYPGQFAANPRWVTRAESAAGFSELADSLLSAH